jgi:ring-1,2-phenylacetyl-CoA epoxidase subunit PaaA
MEESFHQRQGYEIMVSLANGTDEQKEMAQEALNRWWWPSIMMFGPHDKESAHSNQSLKWKIKRESNDELRQRYIDKTIHQGHEIGLTFPDPLLKLDQSTGNYNYSPIDWDEFWNVVKGYGAGNKRRLQHHIKAHEDGKWVREAAKAYAQKKVISKKTA